MGELPIDPRPAEPYPICGNDCPQLEWDTRTDRCWCKVADEFLPREDVVCVPWIQRKMTELEDLIRSAGPLYWVNHADHIGAMKWEAKAVKVLGDDPL